MTRLPLFDVASTVIEVEKPQDQGEAIPSHHLAKGRSSIWPSCSPTLFNLWEIHKTHGYYEGQELQLVDIQDIIVPSLCTRSWTDG